jgi:hypothetical protein
VDRLLVGDDDDDQQRGDGECDRHRQVDRGGAGEHQDQQDLLGGVGHRGHRIGREHRQRDPLAEAFVPGLRQRHRRPHEPAFHERDAHTRLRCYADASPAGPSPRIFMEFLCERARS